MNIALLHAHYDDSHLSEVIAEMRKLGSPTIRAVWMDCYNHWAALEGCHRVRAAAALGLPVIIDEVDYDDTPLSSLGIEDCDYTVEQIADESNGAVIITTRD